MTTIGVSLGNVCHSADWGVQNNIRKKRSEGYNTCPFDLMVSNYRGIIECIYDDFLYFCDTNYLQLTDNGIRHTKYNFEFNHESPGPVEIYLQENWPEGKNHFINNNYHYFIQRYNKRISAFRNYLNDPNNYIIFIIQFYYDNNPKNDFEELRQALKYKYPNLKYEIRVI